MSPVHRVSVVRSVIFFALIIKNVQGNPLYVILAMESEMSFSLARPIASVRLTAVNMIWMYVSMAPLQFANLVNLFKKRWCVLPIRTANKATAVRTTLCFLRSRLAVRHPLNATLLTEHEDSMSLVLATVSVQRDVAILTGKSALRLPTHQFVLKIHSQPGLLQLSW